MRWYALSPGMLVPRLDEPVPVLVCHPMVLLPKQHEELGHLMLVRNSLVRNLPQLVGPALLTNHGHFVHAQEQGLVDAVAAREEVGCGVGGVGRHGQQAGHEPPDGRRGEQPEAGLCEEVEVSREHGGAADEIEVHALGALGEVGDGGEQQDARGEVQAGRDGRLVQMAVEDLKGNVRAQAVAHEHDGIKGLAVARGGAGDGVGGEEVLEGELDLGLDVEGEVCGGVEGGRVVCVVEAGVVAPGEGEEDLVRVLGFNVVEQRAQACEEGDVVRDVARVAGEEVEEGVAGGGVLAKVRGGQGELGSHFYIYYLLGALRGRDAFHEVVTVVR